jgi:hypothetical protein
VADEKQEMVADQETLALLKRFSRDPGVAKARNSSVLKESKRVP